MAGSAIGAVNAALYALLNADGTLNGNVYLNRPPSATCPAYVLISDSVEVSDNTFGNTGRIVTTSIDVWSRQLRSDQVTDWATIVDGLLDFATVTVAGYTHTYTKLLDRLVRQEKEYVHSPGRYETRVEE